MSITASFAFLLILTSGVGSPSAGDEMAQVHYQGRLVDARGNAVSGPAEVLLSVWRGGSGETQDSGEKVFEEKATITANPDGTFNHWLGKGAVLHGSLNRAILAAGEALFIQKRATAPDSGPPRRSALRALDNVWLARDPDWIAFQREARWSFKGPRPTPGARPDNRRGQATLYPDGVIQREDGTLFETTGSKTAGVQELFDYCAERLVDGYIAGGPTVGGGQVVYALGSPVHVPPMQGFRFDTGAVNLIFTESLREAPGLTIDSCMMVDFRIRGQINYAGTSYAVAFKPTRLLPLDTFVGPTLVDSSFQITTVATGAGCVLFEGSINYCEFSFNEINGGPYGLHVRDSSFSNNRVTCKHVHNQSEAAVKVGGGSKNVWEINVNPDAHDSVGIDTAATDDIWLANVHSRSKAGIVLRPAARGNQFHIMGLTGGFDNQAAEPTNRFYISPSGRPEITRLGFSVDTPPVPPTGQAVKNRNPYPVIAMILEAGSVAGWQVTDVYGSAQTVNAPLTSGQCVYLSPGETITLNYSGQAPTWRWRAVQ